jgi:hypothetical protein
MGAGADDASAGSAHMNHAVADEAVRADLDRVEPLAGHRFDRVPPELRDVHAASLSRANLFDQKNG